MLCIIVLLLITIAIWLLYSKYQSNNLPPGPVNLPVIGALYVFADKSRQPHEVLTDLSKKYGGIFGLQMGSLYTVVLSDPTLIREAFKRDEYAGRAPLYLTHGIMEGKGIICAEGTVWREQRKCSISWLRQLGMVKMQTDPRRNDLGNRIMRNVHLAVQTVTNRLIDTGTAELDLEHIIGHSLGNAMNDLVFGVTYSENDPTWKYLFNVQLEGSKYMGCAGIVNYFPLLRFLPNNRRNIKLVMDGLKETHKIYSKLIDKVEAELRSTNYTIKEHSSILELFLHERHARGSSKDDPEFGDSQLRFLLADLFGAGLDTTSATLRWLFLYVALDSRVQQKLNEEFRQVLPSECADVTLEHYDSLRYLRACITEAQRIRAVVPTGVPHGNLVDTQIESYSIPKGTMIMPLACAMHLNPDEWPEPEQYKPERFYDNEATSPYFMPYQMGKRMCLGMDLSKFLLFLFAGNLLRRFTMQLTDDCEEVKTELLRGEVGFTWVPAPYKVRVTENVDKLK